MNKSIKNTVAELSDEGTIGLETEQNQPNFVAFRVSDQDYCVDILAVREISNWIHITPLPKSVPFILGVINLRGAVVPILDCLLRFGLTSEITTEHQVIIVVRVGERTLGLLVDEVTEILNLPHSAIKPVPEPDVADGLGLVAGVIVQEKRMIRLVDLSQVVDETDLAAA